MTDIHEKLAYLLDDDSGKNTSAAIDEAIADVNLQYQVRRYRMIGEVMRHEVPWVIDTDFHNRVMDQIREEVSPVTESTDRASSRREDSSAKLSVWLQWLTAKPVAGLAVAAAVAVVTVTLWQPPGSTDTKQIATAEPIDKIIELINQPVGGTALPASSGGMRWVLESDSPGLQRKLNAYLVNHTEHSSSVQGLIPQARVAGFDAQQ